MTNHEVIDLMDSSSEDEAAASDSIEPIAKKRKAEEPPASVNQEELRRQNISNSSDMPDVVSSSFFDVGTTINRSDSDRPDAVSSSFFDVGTSINRSRSDSAKPPSRRVSPELNEGVIYFDDDDDDDDENDSNMAAGIAASLKEVTSSHQAVVSRTSAAYTSNPSTRQLTTKVVLKNDKGTIASGILNNIRAGRGNYGVTNATTMHHIQQPDRWSCGFRNLQMVLSALVPTLPMTHSYFDRLKQLYSDIPGAASSTTALLALPSVRDIQQQLEACWKEGYDPNGRDHFHGKIVDRKSKIGAVEVSFLFRFWSIDSCVIQFIKCRRSRELLPLVVYRHFRQDQHPNRSCSTKEAAHSCIEWAEEARKREQRTNTPNQYPISPPPSFIGNATNQVRPLYLQWEGHSVTVIGIEPNTSGGGIGTWKRQWRLLILDPSKHKSRYSYDGSNNDALLSPFRMECSLLAEQDIQLVLAGSRAMDTAHLHTTKDATNAITADNGSVMAYVAAHGS